LEDNDPNQSLSSIISDGISNEYSSTTNGNNSSELIHILAGLLYEFFKNQL